MVDNLIIAIYVCVCVPFLILFAREEQKWQFREWQMMREKAERVRNAEKMLKLKRLEFPRQ